MRQKIDILKEKKMKHHRHIIIIKGSLSKIILNSVIIEGLLIESGVFYKFINDGDKAIYCFDHKLPNLKYIFGRLYIKY